jgi:hypothetical protein
MNLLRIRGLQAEVTRIENFSPHGRSRRQAYEKIVGKTDLYVLAPKEKGARRGWGATLTQHGIRQLILRVRPTN